jgi:hypothetical protein
VTMVASPVTSNRVPIFIVVSSRCRKRDDGVSFRKFDYGSGMPPGLLSQTQRLVCGS